MRVSRILRRICQASLQVMLRTSEDRTVTVKGRAANVLMDSATPCMRISNISDKGMQHLLTAGKVQVEFIMMSTKVVFVAPVVTREQNSLLVKMPKSLVSIERRRNARYQTTDELHAFLKLSIWKPFQDDITAPPFFNHFKDIGGLIPLADVSFGGFCAVTRFPAVSGILKRGLIDDKATLVFPMLKPFDVGIEIRWFKKIKEHLREDEQSSSFQRFYKFGVEFTSQSDEARLNIRQFLQQLSQAGAI